mgnify:CR=1 FL=1
MEENKEVTIREALVATMGILNDISVPIGLLESVGLPIMTAANNLNAIIRSIDEAAKEEKKDGI